VKFFARDANIEWTLDDFARFVDTWLPDKSLYVTWNGGEPSLEATFIDLFMQKFTHLTYQIQTNATRLGSLSDYTLDHLDNILCSYDGNEEITDRFRGEGTSQIISTNIEGAKLRGYTGTIVARVTLAADDISATDIVSTLDSDLFSHVYFQLADDDLAILSDKYTNNIKHLFADLIAYWFESTKLERIIPIMGAGRNIVWPEISDREHLGKSQCRVSNNILNLMPNGEIYPCPQLVDDSALKMGSIIANTLEPSRLQPFAGIDCAHCESFDLCKIRCLYQKHKAFNQMDAYESDIMVKHCDIARYFFETIRSYDVERKIAGLSRHELDEIKFCKIYKYVEVSI
jgi:radical SAM protein with 4Fe4S-binding SPASM domain